MAHRPRTSSQVAWPVTTAGFAAFLVLGTVQASFGPSIPAIVERYHLSIATAGLAVTAHFLGVVLGVVVFGLTHSLWTIGRRATAAASVFGVALLVASLAPSWPLLLASLFVVGMGYGGVAVIINLFFAVAYGRRSAAMLSLVNAAYGVGSFLGPALVAAAHGYGAVFAVAGVGALLCAVTLRTTPTLAVPVPADLQHEGRHTRALVAAFVVMLFAYVGVEAGIGTWEPTQLVALGWQPAFAAGATSTYWALFTLGRIVGAPLAIRYAPERILAVSLVLIIVLLGAVRIHLYPPATYALIGLCVAPIFPVALFWLSRLAPGRASASTYVLIGSSLGSALIPAALGKLIGGAGPDSLPIGLALCAIGALVLVAAIALRFGNAAARPSPQPA